LTTFHYKGFFSTEMGTIFQHGVKVKNQILSRNMIR